MDTRGSRSGRRFGAALAALTAVASVGLVVLAAPADAAVRIRVSDTTDLVDGQIVRVGGVGYTPGASIAVITCEAGATTQDDCDTSNLSLTTADANGGFAVHYRVRRIINTVNGGRQDCAHAVGSCIVVAANTADTTEATGLPLSFDPNVPPLPALKVFITVSRVGSINADGSAVVTGTVHCSHEASGSVFIFLRQTLPGEPQGYNGRELSCTADTTAWAVTVPSFTVPFGPGDSIADVSVDMSDGLDSEFVSDHLHILLASARAGASVSG